VTRCCIGCVTRLYVIRFTRRTLERERERERVAVAPSVEKMVETRLSWFGHVERRFVNFVVTRVD
jgi:hypothetical protein